MSQLLREEKAPKVPTENLGVVPLGTPLIAGPAVLTTVLVLEGRHGITVTLVATVINILIAGLAFSATDLLMRIFGKAGSKAASKVASIMLASIAVMMVRNGLAGMVRELVTR